MDGKVIVVGVFAFALIAAGCTSLKSRQLAGEQTSPSGLTYRLPVKKFTVTASLEVTGCEAQGDKALIEAAVSATLAEALIGGEAYTIDYQDLNTWTKITNTEFQISEAGLLTGVNASITDQSGAILTNTASAVASVARATTLPPILAPVSATQAAANSIDTAALAAGEMFNAKDVGVLKSRDPSAFYQLKAFDQKSIPRAQMDRVLQMLSEAKDPCSDVKGAVDAKKNAEFALKGEQKKEKQREASQKVLDQSVLQLAALKGLIEFYDKLGNETEKAGFLKRMQIVEQSKQQSAAEIELLGPSKIDELSKTILKAKEKLTISVEQEFVPDSKSEVCINADAESRCGITLSNNSLDKLFGGSLQLDKVVLPTILFSVKRINVVPPNETLAPDPDNVGIAYRIPVPAIANVEYKKNLSDTATHPLVKKVTQVPQFGPIGSLDLDNQAFDDNMVEVAFNPATGSPSKLTFRAKSKGENASAAARDTAATYLQLQQDKRSDQIAANKATIDQSNLLIDQATARAALEKAQSDLSLSKVQSATEGAKLQAGLQQSLIEAQLQLTRDQQRLDAVRTGTATAAEIELEALKTQEELLAQRLKILKLQQSIAEQTSSSTN